MSFTFDVNVNLSLPVLKLLLTQLLASQTHLEAQMSKISDALAALTVSVDAALARVAAELPTVQALQAENAALKAEAVTDEDLATVASNQAKLDALATVAAVVPAPAPEPAPEPTP